MRSHRDRHAVIVLGLETATAQVGCALGDDEGLVASFHLARGRRHAESLAPAIEHLCWQSGIGLDQVGAIAVDIGPGLFTGLRVGVATAKALAAALGLPTIGLASLDVVAHPHGGHHRLIASVVDARRGEVFWALYRPVAVPVAVRGGDLDPGGEPCGTQGSGVPGRETQGGGVQRITEYAVAAPGDLASQLRAQGENILAVGDGACRYAEVLADRDHVVVAPPSVAHPSASVLVELAHARARRGEFLTSAAMVPLYLRPADVRIGWQERVRPGAAVPPAGPVVPPSDAVRPDDAVRPEAVQAEGPVEPIREAG